MTQQAKQMNSASDLPMPRLQFRWRKPNKRESKRSILGHEDLWVCDYELILPLEEHDIRRKRGRNYLAIKLGSTMRGSSAEVQDDAPYRDGAHASWDGKSLGNPPVFVIGSDGIARERVKAEHGWRFIPWKSAA
jgi:hypothetical protein